MQAVVARLGSGRGWWASWAVVRASRAAARKLACRVGEAAEGSGEVSGGWILPAQNSVELGGFSRGIEGFFVFRYRLGDAISVSIGRSVGFRSVIFRTVDIGCIVEQVCISRTLWRI